jgi:hypothetical protein
MTRSLPQTSNTKHSNPNFRKVRIIRPHHPLYGQSVTLVKIWQHKKRRYYVIELPDNSHTRIPLSWADDGNTPLPQVPPNLPFLTIDSIRQLSCLLANLKNKSSMNSNLGLSSPYSPKKEIEYGKADDPVRNRRKT